MKLSTKSDLAMLSLRNHCQDSHSAVKLPTKKEPADSVANASGVLPLLFIFRHFCVIYVEIVISCPSMLASTISFAHIP
jgi:hypothetical protein